MNIENNIFFQFHVKKTGTHRDMKKIKAAAETYTILYDIKE